MPPKGFKTITVTRDQYARLTRMKKTKRLGSIAECIEYLLRLTVW